MDRYDREPLWAIAVCFLWGAFGATTLGGTANFLIGATLGLEFDGFFLPVIVAPLTEEPAKALVLLGIMSARPFDNTTDGFVYGAVTGLGFAAAENLQYFQAFALEGNAGEWLQLTVVRTGWTAMVHATATSIVGAAVGSLRFRPDRSKARIRNAFIAAIAIHSAWNLSATWNLESVSALAFAGIPLLVLGLLLTLQACLWGEHKLLKHELQEEASRGSIPPSHVTPLCSWWARHRGNWLAESIPREQYIKTATRLAFRLHQLRFDPENGFLKKEVKQARIDLRMLLKNQPSATRS
ncbi:MAG: PrsW family intramembrane metalloprotease [Myxococcota bacterium]|nr:PrsW family intramembrane metalloprotease [Myxococcota bacterium]